LPGLMIPMQNILIKSKFSRKFKKSYSKAPVKIQNTFKKRFELFKKDQNHPLLRNHALIGEHDGCRSINVTGDWRAVYIQIDSNSVKFITIGTHSQLYE